MKPASTAKTLAISDDDAPKLTQADFDRARFRVGGKPVSKAEWQGVVRARMGRQPPFFPLSLPLEGDGQFT